jgi:hypothetical protein
MNKNMTAGEWTAKARWEGGIEPGFEYGLTPDDLTDDVDPVFRSKVALAYQLWQAAQPAIDELDAAMEEIEEVGEESAQ